MHEVCDDMHAVNKADMSMLDKRITKLKKRISRDWSEVTLDEIELAKESIDVILFDDNFTGEVRELALLLKDVMSEQIPEHMI